MILSCIIVPYGAISRSKVCSFEEKVKRTVYLDDLSPQVTESVIKSALGQFGNVVKVQFVPNYLESSINVHAALVEMETEKQAKDIISEMTNSPFMMSGMPRPVIARKANIYMFDDRPIKPGKMIIGHWLDPKDPDFQVATKIKYLVKKHSSEALFTLKHQISEEEKLHNQHTASLKANYRKYELIDNAKRDGCFEKLAKHYRMKIID